jgi:hypothetical protein
MKNWVGCFAISKCRSHWLFLQNEVFVLYPRVAFLHQQRMMLIIGNNHLRQQITALAQDKIFKDGECHGLT